MTVDELRASIERVFVDVPTSELPMPSTHPPNAPALVSWFVSDEAAVIEIFAKWPRSRRELTVAHVTSHGDLGEAMQRRVDELVAYVRECRHDAFPLRASVVHDDARLHELVARTRAPIAHDDPDFSTRYNAREALLDELGRELSPRVARYLLEIVDDSNAACWLSDHGVIEVRPWLVTALASADAFTVAFRARQLAHLDAWRATTRGFGIALDASVVG